MISVAAPQNCSGCRLCALACSFHNTPQREFSLAAAAIRIGRVRNENTFQPEILDDCTGCGRCVSYCAYGVLAEEQGGQS
jgi:NAD-dependent dihydropyrimidine dehydrogenase PreA subunit